MPRAHAFPGQDAGRSGAPSDTPSNELVVVGRRGAAELPPELEYDPNGIDAFGAYDIDEVLRRIAEANMLGEAPVVIVNGRRVADPGVFLSFPPDALARVEVLPPQAGATYGGDPSRRVVNIVLQRKFKSRDGQLDAKVPTAGGMSSLDADVRQGSISGNDVNQFGIQLSRDSPLLAAERPEYVRAHPGSEALSLRGEGKQFRGNLAFNRALGNWSGSLNIQPQLRENRSVSLDAGEPIESRTTGRGISITGGLNGHLAGWSLQASLNGALSHSRQTGLSGSISDQQSLNAALSANRTLIGLPAGPVVANFTAQGSRSSSITGSAKGRQVFPARSVGGNASLAIPLWKAPAHGTGSFAARLAGGMMLTLSGNVRQSDAGRGHGVNVSLAWAPLRKLRLNGTWSTASDSLVDSLRFAPEFFGAPITVFDFAAGAAVQVLPILGGSPSLRQPHSERVSLSAFAGPFTRWELVGGVSLQRSNTVDGLGSLPTVTPELEAAFPERFRRDAQGHLQYIDQRPINFEAMRSETMTSTLGFTLPIEGKRGGGRQGTLRIALSDDWQLHGLTVLRPGLAEMDRLAGDGGGQPRHQVNLQLDGRIGQWGGNLAARWRSGYRIRRENGRDDTRDLLIGALGTVDLRLSHFFRRTMAPGATDVPARRGIGMQLSLEIANLFDVRPGAQLGDGRPAPGYGRYEQGPIGRTVQLIVRRRF